MEEKSVWWVMYEIDIQNFTSDLAKEPKAAREHRALCPGARGSCRAPGAAGGPKPVLVTRRCAASLETCACSGSFSCERAGRCWVPAASPLCLVGRPAFTLSNMLRYLKEKHLPTPPPLLDNKPQTPVLLCGSAGLTQDLWHGRVPCSAVLNK